MEQYSLPISMIRQHMFCPRIPYFNETLGVKVISPPWTAQGNVHHKKQTLLSKRRTFDRFGISNVTDFHFDINLKNDNYRIHGICDSIIETPEEIIPIEFKLTTTVLLSHRLQLVAYALAAEDLYSKKCQLAFVLTGEKSKANLVEVNKEIRNQTIKTIDAIYENINNPIMPASPANGEKCCQCEFLNYCNDRF